LLVYVEYFDMVVALSIITFSFLSDASSERFTYSVKFNVKFKMKFRIVLSQNAL